MITVVTYTVLGMFVSLRIYMQMCSQVPQGLAGTLPDVGLPTHSWEIPGELGVEPEVGGVCGQQGPQWGTMQPFSPEEL